MNMKTKVNISYLRGHGGGQPGGGVVARPRTPGEDIRCHCHRLLARSVPTGIELRCPRCKQNMVLTWSRLQALEAGWQALDDAAE